MQNYMTDNLFDFRKFFIDRFADQNESLLLTMLRKGDLKEIYKLLRNSTDANHSDARMTNENEAVNLATALEVLFCHMTEIQDQAVELTTPPYRMAGRRYIDTAKLVLCYGLAKRSTERENNTASNVDDILHRMRNCVAQSIVDRSFNNNDLNTCGEVLPHQVMDILSMIKVAEKVPDSIMTEIQTEVLYMFLTKRGYLNKVDERGETILTLAASTKDIDIQPVFDFKKKFDLGCAFLDRKYTGGKTALMHALQCYRIEKIRPLVENGASVNVQDNRGFTALHAAFYDSHTMKVTLQTFIDRLSRKELISRENFIEESLKSDNENEYIFNDEFINHVHVTKQTIVEILLASGNANVNAVDFTGRTPLDHALDLRTMINQRTVDLLRDEHGAVSLTRSHLRRGDSQCKGGRTALHRLIIDQLSISKYGEVGMAKDRELPAAETLESIRSAVEPQREKFRILTEIGDERGRTPLHYAAMLLVSDNVYGINLTKLLLIFNPCLTASDDNRQTPLHFARYPSTYEWFVKNGANKEVVDKWGQTPESLYRLRCMADHRMKNLYDMRGNILQILFGDRLEINARDETLSLDNSDPTLRNINEEQRDAANTSSEAEVPVQALSKEAKIWKIYNTINEPLQCVRLLNCLTVRLQDLIARAARAIGQRDLRFKCDSKLIGSSNDGTKIEFPGDFDFDLNLTELGKYCEAVPSVTTSPGYVHLKKKKSICSLEEDEFKNLKFDEFFNEERLLLTSKVNCMFKFHLLQVLKDPVFWKSEDLFELDLLNEPQDIYEISERLHSRVRIRMIHPVAGDSNGDQMFVDTLLLDVVPSIRAPGRCIEEALTGDRCSSRQYNLVFDPPQRYCPWVPFGDTFARISFGVAETNAIKNCPRVLKTAFIVCRAIMRSLKPQEHAYYLKTCLFYCIETFDKARSTSGYDEVGDAITSRNLYFWVERIFFCYAEFFNQDFLPCYFMSSFSQPTGGKYLRDVHMNEITRWQYVPFASYGHEVYTELFSTDFASDINCPRPQPLWEDFNREKFMRKLSKKHLT